MIVESWNEKRIGKPYMKAITKPQTNKRLSYLGLLESMRRNVDHSANVNFRLEWYDAARREI